MATRDEATAEREKLARRADDNYRERIYDEIAEDLWAVLDRRDFDSVRYAVDAIAAGEIRHLYIVLGGSGEHSG